MRRARFRQKTLSEQDFVHDLLQQFLSAGLGRCGLLHGSGTVGQLFQARGEAADLAADFRGAVAYILFSQQSVKPAVLNQRRGLSL